MKEIYQLIHIFSRVPNAPKTHACGHGDRLIKEGIWKNENMIQVAIPRNRVLNFQKATGN